MAAYPPLPSISGLLTGFVAVDMFAGYFAAAQTLTGFQPALREAPDGGSVTIDLRTATGGGGSGLTAVIPDGAKVPASPVTGSISIAAGTTMYSRITAESGSVSRALGLYGVYEIEAAAAVPATTALTSLALVKAFKGIGGTANNDTLNVIIAGVSAKMQSHMKRSILSQTITAEKHDASGLSDIILLDEYPIIQPPAVVVRLNGTVVDATTYEEDEGPGELIRVTSGAASMWAAGRRAYEVDYTAGYAAVPEDLSFWATKQVIYEFLGTSEGDSRLGSRGEIIDAGGSAQYLTGPWAPGVLDAMAPYRNARIF